MPQPFVEDVFKRSGLPTYTFVEPQEFKNLFVRLRTPGRGLVVEGPSGIGKTTAVLRAIQQAGLEQKAQLLSSRRPDDVELIRLIPSVSRAGVIIIDDFHRLDDNIKAEISNFLKYLADVEDASTKIVLVGINRAGDVLVNLSPDLNNRIDTIRFDINPTERVRELIRLGENALNIDIPSADALAKDAEGSFHIAQILAHELCLAAGITERREVHTRAEVSIETVKDLIIEELGRTFRDRTLHFARGKRFRRAGRAPYLNLLRWLAESEQWTLPIDHAIATHPDSRGSVGQIVEKGYLESFLGESEAMREVLHFDKQSRVLAVEDPKFIYFLRNLLWSKFYKEAGFVGIEFRSRYDFALSFAGADRDIAELLKLALLDEGFEVFYDRDEQHRIIGEDVQKYLAPIYRTEARFVIPLLGQEYPQRVWAKFESSSSNRVLERAQSYR